MAARAIGTRDHSFGWYRFPSNFTRQRHPKKSLSNLIHDQVQGADQAAGSSARPTTRSSSAAIWSRATKRKEPVRALTEEELDALEPAKTNSLEIVEFVPAGTVDWIYISKTYYLGPDKGGDKAYRLLSNAMDRTQKIAVGRYFTRGKEQLVSYGPIRWADPALRVLRERGTCIRRGRHRRGDSTNPIEAELADKLIAQLTIPNSSPNCSETNSRAGRRRM